MKLRALGTTAAVAGACGLLLCGCADEALEPFYLQPIDVRDASFAGGIGDAEELEVVDDAPTGERDGEFISVTTEGGYDGGDAMTIVTIMTWNRSLRDALRPGLHLERAYDVPLDQESPDDRDDRADEMGPPDPDDTIGVDVIGCAGPDPETWYDKPADEIELDVSDGDAPGELVVDYAAVFRNDDEPDLPPETRVTGRFAFVP